MEQISLFADKQKSTEWKWYLKDLCNIPQNGLLVFSAFSGGGGVAQWVIN